MKGKRWVWVAVGIITIALWSHPLPLSADTFEKAPTKPCSRDSDNLNSIEKGKLNEILDGHELWIAQGKQGEEKKARLVQYDLRRGYFTGRNLSEANLSGSNLQQSEFVNTIMKKTELESADLRKCNLAEANLQEAVLNQACLQDANLMRAHLEKAYLHNADLSHATLYLAKLNGARMLDAILDNANLRNADLSNAILLNAKIQDVNLSNSTLNGAMLEEANLSRSSLQGLTLIGMKFTKTNLTEANLSNTDLSSAELDGSNLTGSYFSYANMTKVKYQPQPGAQPVTASIASAAGLSTLKHENNPQGLMELREQFKKGGFREQERQVTYAIKYNERIQTFNPIWSVFNYIFFELACGWGMYPGRPLWVMLLLIPVFSTCYYGCLIASNRNGIWRVWHPDRLRKDQGRKSPERLRPKSLWPRLGYALYFSILSAFHIGWRDLNVGSWIARMQPREYTLRATGWVRFVSGLQSLISVYLLALAVLTYFGRPFE